MLVGSNDKSGFYEYVSNCEYHFHELPIKSKYFSSSFTHEKNFLIENLSSLQYDSTSNHLIASFRPQSNPTRHELYELITQPNQSLKICLQLIQTFIGSSINIILSRSKILHKNNEIYILASDNGSHGVLFLFVFSNLLLSFTLDRNMEYSST